jgi:uncharacterized protein (TIGR03437 family)
MRALLYFAVLPALWAQVDVLTANYDNNRTNANLGEFVLNKANVNPTQFGKLFTLAVDGDVYAQPLYKRGVDVAGAARNVLFVATMNNSVYAFDADATSSTAPIWKRNFGVAVDPNLFSQVGFTYTDILAQIGILSTPVIDPSTNTLYVVNFTFSDSGNGNVYAYYLHALDLATGAEKFNGPVHLQASVPGSGWGGLDKPVNNQLSLNAGQHLQRAGLLLLNGTVYIAFGSIGDFPPWHGWLLGYDAATLNQTAVFNATSNDGGASIWQGGRGLAADAAGNIYCATGNGSWNGTSAWGESVLRLTTNGGLSVADYFTPAEFSTLNDNDTDLGSTGPVLIPGTNLLFSIGKEGVLFLMDQANLGHQATGNTQVLQGFEAGNPALPLAQQETSFLIFNNAFWDNIGGQILYLWPQGQPPRSYRMENGIFQVTPFSTGSATIVHHKPFPGLTLSAFGSLSDSGILWATAADTSALPGPGTLHAFDAMDLSVELWNSDMQADRDAMGNYTKFANPTVANGKVFTPTDSREIVVYGLLPGVPGVNSVVNAASYASGAVAPGELVTIFGSSIGPASPGLPTSIGLMTSVPTTLDGVQVTFEGTLAPLLYASSGQINAVVPFEVAGQTSVLMTVTQTGGQSYSATLPVVAATPSIFSANASGTGPGAILNNADLSKNSPSNPAAIGSAVVLFATGTGALKPAVADGVLIPSGNPPLIAQPVTVTIGGQDAKVLYQGAAPTFVAGLSQINVQVPAGVTPGPAVPVTITVGGVPSINTVTMAVK